LQKRDTRAANNTSSVTARIQKYPKVTLLAEVRNVTGNAREVAGVILEGNAANGGAAVEYGLVLSVGSVCEGVRVREAPLELVAEWVDAVLDVERLLDK
jgi:hypothetical protein